MTAGLFALPIEFAETFGDPPAGAPVFPHEEAAVARAVDERRREFATVRGCARAALTRLGVSIGLDAEPNEPLSHGGLDVLTLAPEREQLAGLAAEHPEVCWDRLIFSAKETVYKVWFPLTGRPLGFEGAVITIHPRTGTFQARLLVPGPVVAGTRTAGGNWQAGDALVRTAITLTPDQPGGWAGSPGSSESLGPLGPGNK